MSESRKQEGRQGGLARGKSREQKTSHVTFCRTSEGGACKSHTLSIHGVCPPKLLSNSPLHLTPQLLHRLAKRLHIPHPLCDLLLDSHPGFSALNVTPPTQYILQLTADFGDFEGHLKSSDKLAAAKGSGERPSGDLPHKGSRGTYSAQRILCLDEGSVRLVRVGIMAGLTRFWQLLWARQEEFACVV